MPILCSSQGLLHLSRGLGPLEKVGRAASCDAVEAQSQPSRLPYFFLTITCLAMGSTAKPEIEEWYWQALRGLRDVS